MAVTSPPPDPTSPASIAEASFNTTRKGFDQEAVRRFLRRVAEEVTRLQNNVRWLEEELAAAKEAAVVSPEELDEATLTRLLGEETARILQTARESATQIRERAEQGAASLLDDATNEAARMREEAELEAAQRRNEAAARAEAEIEAAKEQGRQMVNEARAYRERVLGELTRRRDLAVKQIEQLIDDRDRLLGTFIQARDVAADIIGQLEPLEQPDDLVDLAPTTGPTPVTTPGGASPESDSGDDSAASGDVGLAPGSEATADAGAATPTTESPTDDAQVGADTADTADTADAGSTSGSTEASTRSSGAAPDTAPSGDTTESGMSKVTSAAFGELPDQPPRASSPTAPVVSLFPTSTSASDDRGDHAATIYDAAAETDDGSALEAEAEVESHDDLPVTEEAGDVRADDTADSDAIDADADIADIDANDIDATDIDVNDIDANDIDATDETSSPDEPTPSAQPVESVESTESAAPTEAVAVDVDQAADDQATVDQATVDQAADDQAAGHRRRSADETTATQVDDLFARLRASSVADDQASTPATETAADTSADAPAHTPGSTDTPRADASTSGDIAGTPTGAGLAVGAGTAARTAVAGIGTADPDADADGAASGDDEPTPFQRRDAALEPLIARAARRLKRVLADEQNELLDTLRQAAQVRALDSLVAAESLQTDRYLDAVADELEAAVQAGAASVASDDDARQLDVAHSGALGPVRDTLSTGLIEPLRERLARSVEEADGDNELIVKRVRSIYREWKTQQIDAELDDVFQLAYGRGVFAALPEGTSARWIVDPDGPDCPDAEDNSLAGAVPVGEPYPTGHVCAPAHEGCRCLLAPVDQ